MKNSYYYYYNINMKVQHITLYFFLNSRKKEHIQTLIKGIKNTDLHTWRNTASFHGGP